MSKLSNKEIEEIGVRTSKYLLTNLKGNEFTDFDLINIMMTVFGSMSATVAAAKDPGFDVDKRNEHPFVLHLRATMVMALMGDLPHTSKAQEWDANADH